MKNKKLTNRQRKAIIGLVATVRRETPPASQHHQNKFRQSKADVTGRHSKYKGKDEQG